MRTYVKVLHWTGWFVVFLIAYYIVISGGDRDGWGWLVLNS